MSGEVCTPKQARSLREALLAWFDQHQRDLPWRRTRDPYAIWVSEVMLQQTRVAAVLEHYARWMRRLPTVGALAAAEEPEVLALWSGLGYYRRARFLHAGARAVIAEHGGVLPRTAMVLRTLPGIGEYTSAAIASIAFGEPVAVVDGNVERVVMRLAGLCLAQPGDALPGESQPDKPLRVPGHKTPPIGAASPGLLAEGEQRSLNAAPLLREIRVIAQSLLSRKRPGDFNQAVMELGATVCLPRAPLCLHCPVQRWCATRGEHPSAPRKAMQSRSIAYALCEREHGGRREILLAQRPAGASLMAGMWELPEMVDPVPRPPLLTLRHSITVTNYAVSIVAWTEGEAVLCHPQAARWVPLTDLPETGLTGLARKALKRLALWPETAAR